MTAAPAPASASDALPDIRHDYLPILLPVALSALALPFVGNPTTWVTLTVAALAMGMMIFVIASGLTLVFGLMDVLNFGHGAFIAVGAYIALSVLALLSGWVQADSLLWNLMALGLAVTVAMVGTGLLGLAFERVIVRPVYGQHLKQILITMGGLIVAEQLIHVIWGGDQKAMALPAALRGAVVIGEVAIERFRILTVAVGIVVFAAMILVLNRTRIGLLIRAGVENPEMVEALGYRIRRLFVGVFAVGSALAGLGGVLWALYRETLTAAIGGDVMVLVFIVIIIGGLGSVGGCFIGAILVAMMANYTAFLLPKVALASNILLMVAILMWRPQGLYPVAKR
ncbi:branched-chain amino acid ABC transporter permease [Phreatobacter cathodiphilus]|uniref:Branched-chain amino acid ABC transporter permease n=1 Tax=Phreatobacter cathodiphilus TaxID=1868589 RepID=A0A2S0NDL8_9HYPH|nr:branched-chain amino acid ABC transporter permease [Phreatobacter cathodiphilus]AVO46264.1 branched-chain amino acid ABC transporter permease [Phreatobacter cathodiphilus]